MKNQRTSTLLFFEEEEKMKKKTKLDKVIDKVIKNNMDMVISQKEFKYCCAGNLIEFIKKKTHTKLSTKQLLDILHEKFKSILDDHIRHFRWTNDQLVDFVDSVKEDKIASSDVYSDISSRVNVSEYECSVCTLREV